MAGTKYGIPQFITDAKAILKNKEPLEKQKAAIGERLTELSKRDDLMRFGLPFGPSDASTGGYLLWREPPATVLCLGEWLPGYMSPVHEHKDFWVVGCGYKGRDRWDMYERLDDGSKPGFAEVKLINQLDITPGKSVWMPAPPRAVHSHNSMSSDVTLEIIFSANKPPAPTERVVYDVENKTCWPSGWSFTPVYSGDYYPARPTAKSGLFTGMQKAAEKAAIWTRKQGQRTFCPVCMAFG
jgi:hypothetical protein